MHIFNTLVLCGVLMNIQYSYTYIFKSDSGTPIELVNSGANDESLANSNNIVVPIQPIFPHMDNGSHHECYRQCGEREPPKTCYYQFHVEWYTSMSKACFDCPFNRSNCESKDCVVGNGLRRTVTVINRQLPGPTIQVCRNDRIIVDVENSLLSSGTTIHWHGMHQRRTPYMDGTPYVTQCPISPESTFRYNFDATQVGTHFYHSHIGLQRADGAFGTFIVREPRRLDPQRDLYDFDLLDHVIILNDWTNIPAMSKYIDHYHSSGNNLLSSLLINGVGRFNVTTGNRTAVTKPASFGVIKGFRYRFRLINAEFLSCPVELSVDGHNITVISSDGFDIQPITAKTLVSFAGERFDFVIEANQEIGSYWIKVRGLLGCTNLEEARQVAVLRYHGASEEPANEPNWDAVQQRLVVNAPNTGEEDDTTVSISKTRSLVGLDRRLSGRPDYRFYIGYDLHGKNNPHFNREPYAFHQVERIYRAFSPQFNHISLQMPKSPLLVSRPSSDTFCNSSTTNDSCIQNFCQCPHVLSVRLNTVVELVLIDEGRDFSANHPFHLHGFAFRVLSQFKLNNSTTKEEIEKMDRLGMLRRNFVNPPIKDTLPVPDGGYSIIRFIADNPGYWLFHCHIEFHAELGMALVFKVGEHDEMLPVPSDFPSCGDYVG